MTSPIGFMVWNPARGMPTVVHTELERALAEAERLTQANPGERFVIMSPVMAGPHATIAKAWSDGRAEGVASARADLTDARVVADRWSARYIEAKAVTRRLRAFEINQRRFQAIVADCLLWFDGFRAAHAGKDEWERPSVPSRDDLRDLNRALLDVEQPATAGRGGPLADEEIPF